MVFNLPGVLVAFELLARPRIVLPSLAVKDIRHLDFASLRRVGYRGAVFDKDNCLTLPHRDALVPELKNAWRDCQDAFGAGNVLIVSNSAGTRRDHGEIQAESVTHHLGVPVLRHSTLKPGRACVASVKTYFASLKNPVRPRELIVVGDRLFTDIVLAHRLRAADPVPSANPSPSAETIPHQKDSSTAVVKRNPDVSPDAHGPLAIWTTGVWKRESMAMRAAERGLLSLARRWTTSKADAEAMRAREAAFVREPPSVPTTVPAKRRLTRWIPRLGWA